MVPMKLIGLDLGQTQDFTALAVLRRPRKTGKETRHDPPPVYDVPHLQRFPLGTPYPQIVSAVVDLLRLPILRGSMLVVDQTGVGRAVVDMFTDALHGRADGWFCPITITGGIDVTEVNGSMRVPKKELVACLQVLLQTRRLRIAPSLPDAAVLVREFETFRVKITEAANETFGAWREGQHDDLVLAVALAAWMGERCLGYEGPVGLPTVLGGAGR